MARLCPLLLANGLLLLQVQASFLRAGEVVDSEPSPSPSGRAFLATALGNKRDVPVDMMFEHQARMVSSSYKNVAQLAVIDAQDQKRRQSSPQDLVLAYYRRTFASRMGRVEVHTIENSTDEREALLQRFFNVTDETNGSALFRFESGADRQRATHLLAALKFLDLCSKADDSVGVCITMEPDAFLYRGEDKGILEVANYLFQQDRHAIALQPSDLCEFTKATKRPTWANKETWKPTCVTNSTSVKLGSRTLVLSRHRLMRALPFEVSAKDMAKGFDYAFAVGLRKAGDVVKRIQCNHAFLIKPSSSANSCHGEQYDLARQAHVISSDRERLQLGASTKSATIAAGEHKGFDRTIVTGLPLLIQRLEAGKIPLPRDGAINSCQDMCPSKSRMRVGYAW